MSVSNGFANLNRFNKFEAGLTGRAKDLFKDCFIGAIAGDLTSEQWDKAMLAAAVSAETLSGEEDEMLRLTFEMPMGEA